MPHPVHVQHPGYSIDELKGAPLGDLIRQPREGKVGIVYSKNKEILNIPDDYKVGIVPASDTGAFEMLVGRYRSKTGGCFSV